MWSEGVACALPSVPPPLGLVHALQSSLSQLPLPPVTGRRGGLRGGGGRGEESGRKKRVRRERRRELKKEECDVVTQVKSLKSDTRLASHSLK